MAHKATTMSSAFSIIVVVAAALAISAAAADEGPPMGKQGCTTICGGVMVPYPFGFGPARCSAPGFNLTCDRTSNPPRLLLGNDSSFAVLNISLKNRTVRVARPPVFSGVMNIRSSGEHGVWGGGGLSDNAFGPAYNVYRKFKSYRQYFLGSSGRNELVVTGCNVQATLHADSPIIETEGTDHETDYAGGCATFCGGETVYGGEFDEHYGSGYCKFPVLTDQTSYDVKLKWVGGNHGNDNDGDGGPDLQVPVHVLIAEKGWFNATRAIHLMGLDEKKPAGASAVQVPVIFDWQCFNFNYDLGAHDIGNRTCSTMEGGSFYWCDCKGGYQGNPYLTGGCQDIDECKRPKEYPCFGTCTNTPGSFKCLCPPGSMGNATVRDGCSVVISSFQTNKNKKSGLIIGLLVASGPCLMLLYFGAMLIHRKIKHDRAERLKQMFFHQNRGQLLQQLVSHRSDIAERMVISLKELEKATNSFDPTRKLGGGGHGTVYKGILSDLHVVAIKKSNIVVQREIDEFINEVAILSQINHRNVVKLHGCCLETEVPLLAYEFISNGTLSDHLHQESPRSIPWGDRLRIAGEVGKAIAYLHSAISIPVIHRDIKSSNILLDDALTAKVSDFGASRHIITDQTEITPTAIQGTIGYMDPMYYYTGRLSEKSDVYSFGVLLVELLTRKKPIIYRSSEDDGLIVHFVALFEQDNLVEILDPQVKEEGGREIKEVASLAVSCIKLRGEERPTMRQVEMALEALQKPNESVVDGLVIERNDAENYNAASYLSTRISSTRSLEQVTRQYSLEEEFLLSARYPR